jgi:hypothetical protein
MDLRLFTLVLEPENPVQFSLTELRAFFNVQLDRFTALHKDNNGGFIHRYPAVQCKTAKNTLMAIGISQGADFLEEISRNQKCLATGKNTCAVTSRDATVRLEPFGISGTMASYEFLTPWLALNQQNTRKFYELKGKPERDAFLQKLLAGGLGTLAKSLDYKLPEPISCEEMVRFRKDWIDNTSVMVFMGKFRTNLRIPDYLGMGQSVSLGFGTIRQIPDSTGHDKQEGNQSE